MNISIPKREGILSPIYKNSGESTQYLWDFVNKEMYKISGTLKTYYTTIATEDKFREIGKIEIISGYWRPFISSIPKELRAEIDRIESVELEIVEEQIIEDSDITTNNYYVFSILQYDTDKNLMCKLNLDFNIGKGYNFLGDEVRFLLIPSPSAVTFSQI